ncbi:hypothetical protein FVE67_07475 [Thermosulfurimonas marina]|uniref:Lipopolysaccharide core heptose(I) kinase RfaP n=1 Tax=Thermosulfurimonas marina TaxID=2047767 RepID=A0A6H1WTZ1_9BACT|nr:lipopolysaccharide kinase InaA family protein [Thermosulfurimonas marina]QJA06641.1 hypothetical protein FVE67_07475 [Thermosulfurimonas marina]
MFSFWEKKIFEIVPGWREKLAGCGLERFEAFWGEVGRPFKVKPDREIRLLEVRGQSLFLKRYFRFGALEFVCGAEREWWAVKELSRRGFSVPEPVAFGLERGLRPRRAFSLLSAAPGRRLEDLFREEPEVALRLAWPLAAFAARFHALGFSHQDFYLCHLFFDGRRFFLIDLQRLRQSEGLRFRWIIKDLAELFYSAREVLGESSAEFEKRFLSEYGRFHPWLESPKMLKRLEGKIRKIAAHDAKLKARQKIRLRAV